MPAFGGYVFEVGDDLPALPTNSTGYHFPAGVSVDAADVSRIAAALGIEGEANPPPPTVVINGASDRKTAPHRHCSWPNDGQLSWYYSNAWATPAVEGCAVAGSVASDLGRRRRGCRRPSCRPSRRRASTTGADQCVDEQVPTSDVPAPDQPVTIDECSTPEPPAGVPTADEANAKANELLAALGEDPAAFELETYADEWNASVTAYPPSTGCAGRTASASVSVARAR